MSSNRAFRERDEMFDVVEAADCVVATAFGNIDGLDLSEQLTALRMAARPLEAALEEHRRLGDIVKRA